MLDCKLKDMVSVSGDKMEMKNVGSNLWYILNTFLIYILPSITLVSSHKMPNVYRENSKVFLIKYSTKTLMKSQ